MAYELSERANSWNPPSNANETCSSRSVVRIRSARSVSELHSVLAAWRALQPSSRLDMGDYDPRAQHHWPAPEPAESARRETRGAYRGQRGAFLYFDGV